MNRRGGGELADGTVRKRSDGEKLPAAGAIGDEEQSPAVGGEGVLEEIGGVADGGGIRHLQYFDASCLIPIAEEFGRNLPAFRHDLLLLQEYHVLPGESVEHFFNPKAFRLQLRFDVLNAHLVLQTDGDGGIFLPELEQHQAA